MWLTAQVLLPIFTLVSTEVPSIENDVCDIVRENAIQDLFEDKETILNVFATDEEFYLNLNCLGALPLVIFSNIDLLPEPPTKTRSIMIDFDQTKGLIFHGNSRQLLKEIFPKVARVNPKIRLLIFLTDEFSQELYEKIFVDAWKFFRIFDVFIINDFEYRQLYQPFNVYCYKLFSSNPLMLNFEIDFNFDEGLGALREFMTDRYKNLEQYSLNVVIFKFLMVCDGEEDENGNLKLEKLKFQDAEVLKILSTFANFKVNLVKSSDGIKYGHETINGTFTGSLGMIEYEQADFAANARLISKYNTTNSLCLFPTTITKLKFSIPAKNWDEINILINLYNFLDDSLKTILASSFFILPFLVFALNSIDDKKKFSTNALILSYLEFLAVISFQSVKVPKFWPSRWIIGGVLIVWLIIGNTFSGKMVEFLNTDLGLKDIKSIEDLTKSELIIKIPHPMAILFEEKFENASKSHKFLNKVVEHSRALEKVGDPLAFIDFKNMDEMIKSRKYAMLYKNILIDHLEKKFYDEKGNNLLTHIEESPYEYYFASSVPKTSPFVNRFNEILMRTFEAGLSKYQMMLAMIENDLIYIRRIREGQVPNNELKSISVSQMKAIFVIYLIAMGGCVGVFVGEVMMNKIVKRIMGARRREVNKR